MNLNEQLWSYLQQNNFTITILQILDITDVDTEKSQKETLIPNCQKQATQTILIRNHYKLVLILATNIA